MGLDISIQTDNPQEVLSPSYFEYYANQHELSRNFCYLMCRKDVIHHITELDQIAKITKVAISPIYEMEIGSDDFDLFPVSEEEIQKLRKAYQEMKSKIKGNLDKVLTTLKQLIHQLNSIDNLPELLLPTPFDSLDNKVYFADFQAENRKSYVYNNFGQDLRNFKRFLEYAQSKEANTVWFEYG